MSLEITDTRITSTLTPETATALAAPANDIWTVSWLPGRQFDRHGAITAMTLAETLADTAATPGHPHWCDVAAAADQLALTPSEALLRYQHSALRRLFTIASGPDGAALSIANFLLAWYDAPAYGGFDFRVARGLEPTVDRDLRTVFSMILDTGTDPSTLGYEVDLHRLAAMWRPDTTTPPEALVFPPHRRRSTH